MTEVASVRTATLAEDPEYAEVVEQSRNTIGGVSRCQAATVLIAGRAPIRRHKGCDAWRRAALGTEREQGVSSTHVKACVSMLKFEEFGGVFRSCASTMRRLPIWSALAVISHTSSSSQSPVTRQLTCKAVCIVP